MNTSRITRRALTLTAFALVACLVAPAASFAITRQAVLARGMTWVTAAVPYSQSRWATEAGAVLATSTVNPSALGYRTDCSGFVSMCLGLKTASGAPLSLDTASLPRQLMPITKADLVPGDVILRAKTSTLYGHAVIFGGWADSTKTTYWGLHESSGSGKATRVKITYGPSGFWSEPGFAPYRSPLVRDRARLTGWDFGS